MKTQFWQYICQRPCSCCALSCSGSWLTWHIIFRRFRRMTHSSTIQVYQLPCLTAGAQRCCVPLPHSSSIPSWWRSASYPDDYCCLTAANWHVWHVQPVPWYAAWLLSRLWLWGLTSSVYQGPNKGSVFKSKITYSCCVLRNTSKWNLSAAGDNNNKLSQKSKVDLMVKTLL